MAKVNNNYLRSKLNLILLLLIGVILVGGVFIASLKLLSISEKGSSDEDIEYFVTSLVPQAQKIYQEKGILPSIIIAQAALESDWGRSELSQTYYNLYGIKASQADRDHVRLNTDEFLVGSWSKSKERFKVYDSWTSSMEDYAGLLTLGTVNNPTLYHAVLQATNYQEAAEALQLAGYATDPKYSEKLINLIEANQLFIYDN
ncbi:glycoside hydrolase family 73 protein [Vagococcus intermedius]|uniref:Glycoside hydrolase family 73 protein n=1 Tax=Vagococcus intermedius TaxID=2991418 RepID=A0AAF0I871_9ENTE|nr:glycoside hydrolase family 73 protein [Vagococcus intermedius]WEG73889.1 glycoside hydrolase family 73 protein [Vagococcus intermedius]WEG75973.1 glycoside hydrolase family 73 protein [Vagococcus intermedius]